MGPSFSGSPGIVAQWPAASSGELWICGQFLWPKLGHWADFQSAQLHPGAAGGDTVRAFATPGSLCPPGTLDAQVSQGGSAEGQLAAG